MEFLLRTKITRNHAFRRITMSTMSRALTILILAVFAVTGTAAEDSPSVPKERTDHIWISQNKEINDSIKKMEGKIDLAFVGDSITRRWTGKENQESWNKYWGSYRAVNMGIGGDATQNVLWRLENGQLDGYQARVFVVMIGTNNCWGKQPPPADDVAAGIKKILDLIQSKQPQAKILLLSILPTGKKPQTGLELRAAINKLISKFAGGPVHYMDITAKFLEPDATISKDAMLKDFLHLAPKGYEIWSEAIKDKVKELMGEAQAGKTP
jgi:lysophospholipase L1-like esterase